MRKINPEKDTLIGIHGPLESGKDTVAQTIIEVFPTFYKQYAFAWPIKKACQVMFGFTEADMNDRTLKERTHPVWGITPRKAMQLLGTEYGRNMINVNMWVMRAMVEINKNSEDGYGTIISDVRFDNEAEIIRERNGIIIHIDRPDLDKSKENYNHSSEMGIKREPSDIIIDNSGSLLEFRAKILDIFQEDTSWVMGAAYKYAEHMKSEA